MEANMSPALFCAYCGAANEAGARTCRYCAHPIDDEALPSTTKPALAAGQTLSANTVLRGRYRVIRPVGQGGMGTVYRAQDADLDDRVVAIKELVINDPPSQEDGKAIAAFKSEATLLASLQHANLPSVFEHFTENGRWYMAMTFIQGTTLEEHLAKSQHKKLPLHEVVEIGKQLSSVLYYLHNQYPPIIFRDVKPANIMHTSDGHVYLIDFGVARHFRTGQKKDTVPFGSLGYAAPEQFGKAQTTRRSDIYALGATLYELLTGYDPSSTPLKLPSIRSLEPSLPAKMTTLITQMLSRDANKRPANMLIIEQKLQEIDIPPWQSAQYTASTLSQSQPARKPVRREVISILWVLSSVLCLIAGLALGALINLSNSQARTADRSYTSATTTASASINATATVNASTSATATAIQGIALIDPYPPGGTLMLFDPLTQANHWEIYTDSNFGGGCAFQNGSFLVSQEKSVNFFHCDEDNGNGTLFRNFTIEVRVAIQQGDCGGLTLRESSSSGALYLFDVCNDATYDFFRYASNAGASSVALLKGSSKAIHQNGATNTIAVVARMSTFDLYINHKKIATVNDDTYDIGTIGLVADSLSSPTSVSYQNLIVWALP